MELRGETDADEGQMKNVTQEFSMQRKARRSGRDAGYVVTRIQQVDRRKVTEVSDGRTDGQTDKYR